MGRQGRSRPSAEALLRRAEWPVTAVVLQRPNKPALRQAILPRAGAAAGQPGYRIVPRRAARRLLKRAILIVGRRVIEAEFAEQWADLRLSTREGEKEPHG